MKRIPIYSAIFASLILAASVSNTATAAEGDAPDAIKPAHENVKPGSRADDYGIFVPVPASHPGRRYPATDEFPTGPAIGERLPEFTLPNQHGKAVDFHADRGDSKAIVVFYRSAVW